MDKRLSYAIQVAREAGELTLRYFNDPELLIEQKKDGTPVTAADRGAEELLRSRIAERFPQDAILGEEFPDIEGTSGFRWLLDPIDGTKSFIHGVPLYSTLIGIEKDDVPVIGVIRLPALGEGIWAQSGKGAFWEHPKFVQPQQAHVSTVDSLDQALFLTSEVLTFEENGRAQAYHEIESLCRLTRTWGDAYGYYLLATGRADVMVDAAMSPWDAGPLLTILEEAGGHFTDWNGTPTLYGNDGFASNDALFSQILEITKRYPQKKA